MSTTEEVVELMNGLPEQLRAEVADFARFLKGKRSSGPAGEMRLDWRGLLRDMRDEYTSVELQHKLSEWR